MSYLGQMQTQALENSQSKLKGTRLQISTNIGFISFLKKNTQYFGCGHTCGLYASPFKQSISLTLMIQTMFSYFDKRLSAHS